MTRKFLGEMSGFVGDLAARCAHGSRSVRRDLFHQPDDGAAQWLLPRGLVKML
jgi:hypothetical protein